jgi:hypothetical protein
MATKINWREVKRKTRDRWSRAKDRSVIASDKRRLAQKKRREKTRISDAVLARNERVKHRQIKRIANKFLKWRESHAEQ